MAIVAAIKAKIQSKTAMRKVMDYVVQEKKTLYHDTESGQSYRLISGQNCVAETAFTEFIATKIQHGKDSGVFYKQFVQSFKPEEAVSPKEIHQMGLELAEYFKGFEVLVATHIDDDHWHNHLIINSVNAESGLKIQFNENNLNELREYSDRICKSHRLEVLAPYNKSSPVAGINTREYRAAQKGNSWKFKLMSAIDSAIKFSCSKSEFISNMARMCYGVKWENHHKYITYTTPEGQRCRDNRLHDEKYLKSNMEGIYEHREVQSVEQAGQAVGVAGESIERVSNQSAAVWHTAGGVRQVSISDDRNSQTSSAHAGANIETADAGGLGEEYPAGDRQGQPQGGRSHQRLREQSAAGISQPGRQVRDEDIGFVERQIEAIRADVTSARQLTGQDSLEVVGYRRSVADSVNRAVVDITDLLDLDSPKESQPTPKPQKKKSHKYDRGMKL